LTPEGLTGDDGDGDAELSRPDNAINGTRIVTPMLAASPEIVTSQRASLIDLIGDDKICCPFHDDSTPSLQVYADHFYCFGCDAHGTAVDWLMIIEA
jgi:hypothetical protein